MHFPNWLKTTPNLLPCSENTEPKRLRFVGPSNGSFSSKCYGFSMHTPCLGPKFVGADLRRDGDMELQIAVRAGLEKTYLGVPPCQLVLTSASFTFSCVVVTLLVVVFVFVASFCGCGM